MCKYTNNYGREIVVKENDQLDFFFFNSYENYNTDIL